MQPEAPIEPPVTAVPEYSPQVVSEQKPAVPAKPLKTRKITTQRHYLAVFFLSFMWGTFGVDRMYLGRWGTGILKLVTAGGLGLWTIIDLLLIMGGNMRDKQGREMLQFTEYKKFTYWTVLIFALVIGLVVLINGIVLIIAVNQFFESLQNGGLDSLMNGLPGGSEIPPELQMYL